ncbi:DUF58 domain-containing protein [Hazenella coriacea]|nr:DUF58 domain-containing protein [Hazenella coriacea]
MKQNGTGQNGLSIFEPQFLARLERLKLVSRQMVRGVRTGSRRSNMLGSSLEFADYRSYYPGDDLRQLDWLAYARLGKWFLKTFLDERETDISLYIDVSRSMGWGDGEKGKMAVQLAAALGYLGLHHADRVGAYSFDRQIRRNLPSQQGRGGMMRLFQFLQSLSFQEEGDLNEALGTAKAIPRRPGMSIIFTDGLSPSGYERGLAYLQGARQQVSLVHITSKEERSPSLKGELRLIDCETQMEKQVSISSWVLRRYEETAEAYARQMEEWCFRRGIIYIPVAAEDSIETVVFTILQRSGLVRS